MMMCKKSMGAVLCAAAMGSALRAEVFREEREGFQVAHSVIFTLPLIAEELGQYINHLPEQPGKGGGVFEAQPFWKGVPELFAALASAEFDGQSAVSLKELWEKERNPEDLPRNTIQYGSDLFDSLGKKRTPLWVLVRSIYKKIRPIMFAVTPKKGQSLTPFGASLHKAYGQNLMGFINPYYFGDQEKTLIYDLINGVFNKKDVPFTGAFVRWTSPPMEALCFMLLDFHMLFELSHGGCSRTFNPFLLAPLQNTVKLFFVFHLIRFYEGLVEALQALEEAYVNPCTAGSSDDDTGSTSSVTAAMTGSSSISDPVPSFSGD